MTSGYKYVSDFHSFQKATRMISRITPVNAIHVFMGIYT